MAVPSIETPKKIFRSDILSYWPVFFTFCLFVLHSLLFFYWIIDDAGISFAYARNFIHGHGLVSQIGAEPVEGFSNPLWTFLLAPFFISDPIDPTLIVKGISLMLVLITFIIIHKIITTLIDDRTYVNLASLSMLMILSINTSFVVWTTSGLENPLYALLSVLYCFSLFLYLSEGPADTKHACMAGLTVCGLALTRPEGIVFILAFPLIALFSLMNDVSRWKLVAKDVTVFSLAAIIPLSLYIVFRLAYFKDFFPNTYYVKGGPNLRDLLNLLILKKNYIDKTYELLYSMVHVSAGPSIIALLTCGVYVTTKINRKLPLVSIFVMLFCSWVIYCLLPNDWMKEYRFATPFFVFFYLNVIALTAEALRQIDCLPARVNKFSFGIVAISIIFLSVKIYIPRTLAFADKPTVPFSSIASSFGHSFNDIADQLGIPEASILCPDLGGTLYYSNLKVYDLAGLCDRKFARLKQNNQDLRNYVFRDLKPTFIHIHGWWSIYTGFQFDPRFREMYVPMWQSISNWKDKKRKGTKYLNGDYIRRDSIKDSMGFKLLSRQIVMKKIDLSLRLQQSKNYGWEKDVKNFSIRKKKYQLRLPYALWTNYEIRKIDQDGFGLETSLFTN